MTFAYVSHDTTWKEQITSLQSFKQNHLTNLSIMVPHYNLCFKGLKRDNLVFSCNASGSFRNLFKVVIKKLKLYKI